MAQAIPNNAISPSAVSQAIIGQSLLFANNDAFIRVSGPQAKEYLQGQLTCDLGEINEFSYRLGCYCNHQGRILVIFRIYWHSDGYLLRLPHSLLAATMAQLQKFAMFSKVVIEDYSNEIEFIGVAGPKAEPFLQTMVAKLGLSVIPQDANQVVQNEHLLLARAIGVNVPRYEILVKHNASIELPIEQLIAQLNQDVHTKAEHNIWLLLDILEGIAIIEQSTSLAFLPQALNLTTLNAINFQKGCYVGQEVIARMHYRGKLKNRMYGITFFAQKPPLAKSKIKVYCSGSSKANGTLVTAYHWLDKQYLGLAIFTEDAIKSDSRIIFDTDSTNDLTIDQQKDIKLWHAPYSLSN